MKLKDNLQIPILGNNRPLRGTGLKPKHIHMSNKQISHVNKKKQLEKGNKNIVILDEVNDDDNDISSEEEILPVSKRARQPLRTLEPLGVSKKVKINLFSF